MIRDTNSYNSTPTAAKSQSQKEASSNAYILVSTIPEKYRKPAIIPPSKVQSADVEADPKRNTVTITTNFF